MTPSPRPTAPDTPLVLAVIPVRQGLLPLGAAETIAEAGGSVILIGSNCRQALADLPTGTREVRIIEAGSYAVAHWTTILAPLISRAQLIILPASPDGRDLAPRLAASLRWPLAAGAIRIDSDEVQLVRHDGLLLERRAIDQPMIATLLAGTRSVPQSDSDHPTDPVVEEMTAEAVNSGDAVMIAELPPDPSTMELSESTRILAGGAGLGSSVAFDQLGQLASRLGGSTGGTRVVMDWGWIPFERQIGTTGIMVNPDLYIALGISGAVQHTAGLGTPDHIISVNLDPHCPMMSLADLAIVCDAPDFLDALVRRLGSAQGDTSQEIA